MNPSKVGILIGLLSTLGAALAQAQDQAPAWKSEAITAEVHVALKGSLNVPWRPTLGPAWGEHLIPQLIETARSYKERGLPALALIRLPQYELALGLYKHRAPGLYLSMRLAP